MEFEIYESELADYSLQDSPFYEASTPIIFDLTTTPTIASVFAANNPTSMVDAINLSAKKSSMMMSTKCQSLKLAFERTTNASAIGKGSDTQSNLNNLIDTSSKKRCDTANRFYSDKGADLDTNTTDSNMQPKKKRKCVSFLPNYVQVNFIYISNFKQHINLLINKRSTCEN